MKLGIWIIGALFLASQAIAQSGVVIIDGDTLQIGQTTYRLHGIDAPEHGQKCATGTGSTWACGKEATAYLLAMTAGHEVTCDSRDNDRYGRTIAVCMADGKDLNEQMVSSGMAWAFLRFTDDYAVVERDAKAQMIGIWQAETQTAWDFRAQQWETASQVAPEGCPIKGNISSNGQIYHAPWSPYYKGGLWLVEVESVEQAWDLVKLDPFWPTGLRDKVDIKQWVQVFADGQALV